MCITTPSPWRPLLHLLWPWRLLRSHLLWMRGLLHPRHLLRARGLFLPLLLLLLLLLPFLHHRSPLLRQ